MIYNYIDENMPDWAKPTVQKLIDKGALKGDEKGELLLTGTMLRLFVIHDRMGIYDRWEVVHMNEEKERLKQEKSIYNFSVFCIEQDREYLYNRINLRVDLMVKDGIVEEAKKVYDMKLPKDNTCMQAIGYKEFFPYFEGKETLEEATETLKKETRHYAKRQLTWFNNKLDCIKLDGSKGKDDLVDEILRYINK